MDWLPVRYALPLTLDPEYNNGWMPTTQTPGKLGQCVKCQ